MSPGARLARGARALLFCGCSLAAAGCDGDLVNLGHTQTLAGGSEGADASAGSGAAGSGGTDAWQLQAEPIVAQEIDVLLANPTLTADLQTLYFTRQTRRGEMRTSVFSATSVGTGYKNAAAVALGDLTSADVASPAISQAGEELWLGLSLPAPQGLGGTDVWLSRKTAAGFTTPQLVVELSSPSDDAPRPPSAAGTLMALSSKRHGCCYHQIYLAARADATAAWGQPSQALLESVNDSRFQSGDGFLADGGLELYFASNREGLQSDLYVARRESLVEPFGPPSSLTALNSPTSEERMPWLSDDKKHLFFASNRSGGYALYRADR